MTVGALHLIGLLYQIQAVHQDYPRHLADFLHPCMSDNLLDGCPVVKVAQSCTSEATTSLPMICFRNIARPLTCLADEFINCGHNIRRFLNFE